VADVPSWSGYPASRPNGPTKGREFDGVPSTSDGFRVAVSALRFPDENRSAAHGRGIVHHSAPVSVLTHFVATAIQFTWAGKPVIVLAAYLSPFRPLMGADLTTCFCGELPLRLAGELNAKHVDWNSRLSRRRVKDHVIMPTKPPV
jgi:hypothetical protein